MTSVTMDTLQTLAKSKPKRGTGGGRFNKPGRFAMVLLRVIEDCGPDVSLTRLMQRFEAAHLIFMQKRYADRTAEQRHLRAATRSSIGKLQFALNTLERRNFATSQIHTYTANGKPKERLGWNVTVWGRHQL